MNLSRDAFEELNFNRDSYINISIDQNVETYPMHWHSEYEIIMPLEGHYHVNVNGHSFVLEQYDILFIAVGELHEMPIASRGRRMIVQFDFSLIGSLPDFNSNLARLRSIRFIRRSEDPILHDAILQNMFAIMKESQMECHYKDAYMYSLLLQIYALIARHNCGIQHHFPDITLSKQQEYLFKFTQATQYIHYNFKNPLTLDEVAASVNFSKYHFSRLFHQFTGKTFNSYVNDYRLSEAELLLLNANNSITDVALNSGFTSLSTFNRTFKEKKGVNPSEFRMMYNSH